MWNRIKSLCYKELLSAVRDKKTRTVLFVPPLVQLFIFAFAATLDVTNATIGVLNLDPGEKGFELVERFQGSPTFKDLIALESYEQVPSFIDEKKGFMVLGIDQQFTRNLDAKKPANVQLILDGRRSNTAQIVANYASGIIQQFNDDYATANGIPQQNTALVERNWYNPNLIYLWYNIPCLSGIITMVVAMIITSLSVAREREMGTFDQILVSPLNSREILLGKMIPAIMIGLFEGSLITTVGVLLFRVPFHGSPFLLFLSLLVFVTAIVGIGLFVSSLSMTQQQAVLGSFVVISPTILLSGFATPIENMPAWLQPVTYLIPLRYYLIIAKGLFLKAIPASIVFQNIWPMMLIAVATLSAGAWMFRRRIG